MRPPPFILVLKPNAPDSSETAGTRGKKIFFPGIRIRFKNGKYGVLWALTFCSHLSPTGAAQRLYADACWYTVVLRPSASHAASQGQRTAGPRSLSCQAPWLFFSLPIKWVRASARKLRWRPLAASQTLCLPHPRVGKIASQASFRQRTKQCFLVQVLNHKTQEDRPSHRDRRSWVTSSPSGQNLGAQRQFSFPLRLVKSWLLAVSMME